VYQGTKKVPITSVVIGTFMKFWYGYYEGYLL